MGLTARVRNSVDCRWRTGAHETFVTGVRNSVHEVAAHIYRHETRLLRGPLGLAPGQGVDARPTHRTCRLKTRSQGTPASECLRDMGSVHDHVLRRIGHDCLAKQLFLFYYIRKHDRIVDQSDLHEHIDHAITIIGPQKLDVHLLRRFGLTPDDLIQAGLIHTHPVDLLLHFATGDVDARRSMRDAAMDLRNRLQLVGVAHLKGNYENIARTTWLAGQMLSLDTDRARTAAMQFQDHLLRAKPGHGVLLESWFAAQRMLMAQMSEFADTEPPCHLWRKHGAFTDVYRALAVRFVANKDHELDNEGTHARWQWLCERRRAIQFKMMNANFEVGYLSGAATRIPMERYPATICAIGAEFIAWPGDHYAWREHWNWFAARRTFTMDVSI